MNTRLGLLLCILLCQTKLFSQNINGVVLSKESSTPIQFVNIGIKGKEIGTVSNEAGAFRIAIPQQFSSDSLLFTCIGYQPVSIKIGGLKDNSSLKILLTPKEYNLTETVIKARKFKAQTLGNNPTSKKIAIGFKDNNLGYEMGAIMKVKKSALLKSINIDISWCSYDSIFYRVNIYKVKGKYEFENILKEPIFIKMPLKNFKGTITANIESRHILVDGDFLITIEHLKSLGKGSLYLNANLFSKTYVRKSSQGTWTREPIGAAIRVDADVEK